MQPYFFPYMGYFQLMYLVDRWVAFDQIQFIDKGWINRNRILHPDPNKSWQFVTLPLDGKHRFDRICDIAVKSDVDWRAQILGKLTHYKKKAPYYSETIDLVRACFDTSENSLARLVTGILRATAAYLEIQTPIDVQSEMHLELGPVDHAGQWALRFAEALGACEYINPIGGKAIFKPEEFHESGIQLSFLDPEPVIYDQKRDDFEQGLSIIDVLMWNGREATSSMVRQQQKTITAREAYGV